MRNGEFNKTNTEMTSRNTSAIVKLSDKSGREARVVKTLTVLAMVFVPAAFTAVSLHLGAHAWKYL
jgi:Mg2+ and Co2+ transporter CorA